MFKGAPFFSPSLCCVCVCNEIKAVMYNSRYDRVAGRGMLPTVLFMPEWLTCRLSVCFIFLFFFLIPSHPFPHPNQYTFGLIHVSISACRTFVSFPPFLFFLLDFKKCPANRSAFRSPHNFHISRKGGWPASPPRVVSPLKLIAVKLS